METYYGVYRVGRHGMLFYVPRTVTSNKKLAEEIARDFSEGRVVRPDGSVKQVQARPHVVQSVPR